MQHSSVAWRAGRSARFVRPAGRSRERRLGLRSTTAFIAAPSRRTVLFRREIAPLTALRTPWRTLHVAPPASAGSGAHRPARGMLWTRSARDGGTRRSSVAPAWPA